MEFRRVLFRSGRREQTVGCGARRRDGGDPEVRAVELQGHELVILMVERQRGLRAARSGQQDLAARNAVDLHRQALAVIGDEWRGQKHPTVSSMTPSPV